MKQKRFNFNKCSTGTWCSTQRNLLKLFNNPYGKRIFLKYNYAVCVCVCVCVCIMESVHCTFRTSTTQQIECTSAERQYEIKGKNSDA